MASILLTYSITYTKTNEIVEAIERNLTPHDQSIIETFFKTSLGKQNTSYLQPEHKSNDMDEIGTSILKDRRIDDHLKDNTINEDMSNDKIENAVKYGLEKVEELLTIKEPMWFKMGKFFLFHANVDIIYKHVHRQNQSVLITKTLENKLVLASNIYFFGI